MNKTWKLLAALIMALLMAILPVCAETAQDAADAVEETVQEVAQTVEETTEEAAETAEEAAEAVEEETQSLEELAEEAVQEAEEAPESWAQRAFGGFKELSVTTIVLIIALLALGIAICAQKNAKWTGTRIAAVVACFGAALVLTLISLFRSIEDTAGIGRYIVTIVILLVAMLLVICLQKREKWTSRHVAYAAMCIAMSFVLSMIKLFRMPQGGSVTPASLLPLIMFAMAFGPMKGIVVGCAYGLLQIIEDPYVIHPIQLLVDYPMAFGAVALSCMALLLPGKELYAKLIVGVLLGYLGRFIMAVLSGVVFFAEYAGEQNALIYSMGYNIAYLGVEAVIACLIAAIPGFSRILEGMRKRK